MGTLTPERAATLGRIGGLGVVEPASSREQRQQPPEKPSSCRSKIKLDSDRALPPEERSRRRLWHCAGHT